MKCFYFFVLCLIVLCPQVFAGESDGKECLKKGKYLLEQKRYGEAAENLAKAATEFQILGDYALLWLSDAYHENGEHEKALKTVKSLLKKYSDSPLEKSARIREIKEADELSEDNVQKLFDSYLKDYRNDSDMKYLYARWLKKNNKTEKATRMFREIYISGDSFSELAHNELKSSDITPEDMLKRASSLMNSLDYKGAESALRMAIARSEGILKRPVLTELGHVLFRQKRYLEAAATYSQSQDKYWEMRARYRAKEKDAVLAAVDGMLKADDRRMASVLIAVASDKRREGDSEGAIELFRKIAEKYPSEREEALWGVGWTYFLSGEYKKASDVFENLFGKYNDSKYLYWQARSLDMSGENASEKYRRIAEKKRDFYSLVSGRRLRISFESPDSPGAKKYGRPVFPAKNRSAAKIERVEFLLELGFSKEAASEMIYISKKTSSVDEIFYICSKLQELGYYKYSVKLASKTPYPEELPEFVYPLAYWDIVEKLSEKSNIDPLLVLAVIREESRFDSEAKSPAGALGLMQLMPGTAYRFDKRLKLGVRNSYDVLNVRNNLSIGVHYLSGLIKDFGSYAPAIASYNAGEDIVKKWLGTGKYRSADEFIEDIPYLETRNYVKKVLASYFEYRRIFYAGKGIPDLPIEKL